MSIVNKKLKIRLPLTEPEKACIDAYVHIYPYACNYVSEYAYRNQNFSQSDLLNLLSCDLKNDYKLNKNGIKSVVKTVTNAYKQRNKLGQRNRRVKFKLNHHELHWGIDYMLGDKDFYLNTLKDRVECKIIDFDLYLGIAPMYFESAKIEKRHGKYYLIVPVKINIDQVEKNKILLKFMFWLLWIPVQRKLLLR